ncbi:MAG: ATP-binding protein [Gemmatimonadota bacterium]
MPAPRPLRRELLSSFGILFAGGVLFAGMGLAFLLPGLESPGEGILYVVILVVADLGVLFIFGSAMLKRSLVAPLERLASDARRIAEGDYHHRPEPLPRLELDHVRKSVNAMADRLIADQEVLAENVASLERSNDELIQARNQVIHTARLASVGTLAAGIAHEVGNPLGAIMAFVDVARARMADEGGDPELLDSIREEARRIDRIVRGLLDYARPKEAQASPASPADVLDRVRDLLENQGKLDLVEASWEIDPRAPDVVMEPHRLEQVLVNLLLNALDAMRTAVSPQIVVRLSVEQGTAATLPTRRADDPPGINYMHRRRVAHDEGGKGINPLFTAHHVVVIEVEDSGPGIPEDDWDAVFDPFFTTKEPGQGTGLGLSICARLVEGMGGHIEVGGSPLGGARFIIRLPGAPEQASMNVLELEPSAAPKEEDRA